MSTDGIKSEPRKLVVRWGVWDWLTYCPADEEDTVLVGRGDVAQGGGSVGKDVPSGDLGKWPRRGEGCGRCHVLGLSKIWGTSAYKGSGVGLLLLRCSESAVNEQLSPHLSWFPKRP